MNDHPVAEAVRSAIGVDSFTVTTWAAPVPPREADAVAAFLDAIPDDGLPDHHGEHYRVVTVCGHCGTVWSSLFATPSPVPTPAETGLRESDAPTLRALIRAAISDAYYEARNDGDTMEHAANVAASAVWTVLEGWSKTALRTALSKEERP